jgi:hypothetical protein
MRLRRRAADNETVEEELWETVAAGAYVVEPVAVAEALIERTLAVLPAVQLLGVLATGDPDPFPRQDAA